jgi:pilus assembly protein Flp/PilA
MIRKFLADESAASAIEYCLIAVGIAGACLVIFDALGVTLGTLFTSISTSLN